MNLSPQKKKVLQFVNDHPRCSVHTVAKNLFLEEDEELSVQKVRNARRVLQRLRAAEYLLIDDDITNRKNFTNGRHVSRDIKVYAIGERGREALAA